MATSPEFLAPLKSFRHKRLYANLNRDFVVPVGTAAFIREKDIKHLRKLHRSRYGIVDILLPSERLQPETGALDTTSVRQHVRDRPLDRMITELEDCGWEKVLVNFPGVLPNAHNKICALTREPKWFFHKVLGFEQGRYVMEHAADWLATSDVD